MWQEHWRFPQVSFPPAMQYLPLSSMHCLQCIAMCDMPRFYAYEGAIYQQQDIFQLVFNMCNTHKTKCSLPARRCPPACATAALSGWGTAWSPPVCQPLRYLSFDIIDLTSAVQAHCTYCAQLNCTSYDCGSIAVRTVFKSRNSIQSFNSTLLCIFEIANIICCNACFILAHVINILKCPDSIKNFRTLT